MQAYTAALLRNATHLATISTKKMIVTIRLVRVMACSNLLDML